MTLDIENIYEGEIDIPFEEIAFKVCEEALKFEHCPFDCEISLLITDDESIKEYNEEFRQLDRSTDVLSFPMAEYSAPADFSGFEDDISLFNPDSGELMLGDIVISYDHVKAQAELYGHGRDREFAFLVAHSMLHLMGYDHMEDEERKAMEERQEAILQNTGYIR